MVEAVFIGTFVPLALLILLLRHSRPVFSCFCWGMIALLIIYKLSPPIYHLLKIDHDILNTAVYLGPPLEEMIKPVPLYFLACFSSRSLVPFFYILGVACGIGFAIEENLIYLIRIAASEESSQMLMVVRSFSTCLMHGVATGLVGYTITMAIRKPKLRVAIPVTFAGLLLASIYHGTFNWLMLHDYTGAAVVLSLVLFGLFLFTMKVAEVHAPETKGTIWG